MGIKPKDNIFWKQRDFSWKGFLACCAPTWNISPPGVQLSFEIPWAISPRSQSVSMPKAVARTRTDAFTYQIPTVHRHRCGNWDYWHDYQCLGTHCIGRSLVWGLPMNNLKKKLHGKHRIWKEPRHESSRCVCTNIHHSFHFPWTFWRAFVLSA